MSDFNNKNPNDNLPEEIPIPEGMPEEIAEAIREFFKDPSKIPSNGQIFLIRTPDGKVNVSTDPKSVPINLSSPKSNYVDIPVLRKEWIIRLVDVVPNRIEDNFTFSLEVFPNFSSKMETTGGKVDIYDIMNLIKNPSFLNFLLSSLTHANVWHPGDIHTIANLSNGDAFIRAIVPNATSVPPKWIRELSEKTPGDFEVVSRTENFLIGQLDTVRSVIRSRHLYEPLIQYDVTVTLNSADKWNFLTTTFDHVFFYNFLVRELLEDAVKSFYPINNICMYMLNNLWQLHTFFNVAILQNTLRFFLDVSPGTVFLSDGLPHQYEYLGKDVHAVYQKTYDDTVVKDMKDRNDRYLLRDQIAAFNWSSKTQVYPAGIGFRGTKFVSDDEVTLWKTNSLIFNAGISIEGHDGEIDNGTNLIQCKIYPSNRCSSLVSRYWVPCSNEIEFTIGSRTLRPICIIDVNLAEMVKLGLKDSDDILHYLIDENDNVVHLIQNRRTHAPKKFRNAYTVTESLVLNQETFRFMVSSAVVDNLR